MRAIVNGGSAHDKNPWHSWGLNPGPSVCRLAFTPPGHAAPQNK